MISSISIKFSFKIPTLAESLVEDVGIQLCLTGWTAYPITESILECAANTGLGFQHYSANSEHHGAGAGSNMFLNPGK